MRYVYLFHEGNAQMKSLLGGKGANLAEMTNLGLPVPYGMTISTDACRDYYAHGGALPEGLVDEVMTALARVEEKVGKRFGDEHDPLLLSVRSGAVFSISTVNFTGRPPLTALASYQDRLGNSCSRAALRPSVRASTSSISVS